MTTSAMAYIKQNFDSKDYTLVREIGQGGFGIVAQAIHEKTQQNVAIKFVHLDAKADEKYRQRQIARFNRESYFVSQLSHPNIVRLLDKGCIEDSNVYSVFEYVDGISLSEHLKQQGSLSIDDTYHIMLQVLDALLHAHQQGIIHRDIKPSNIMLSQTGARPHVKLLDFGISTLTLGQRSDDYNVLTITQESIGTPTYSAPEQLRGEQPTFGSDLYMWGLVFIECLTGAPAVSGSSVAEIYHQHLNQIPIPMPNTLLSHPLGHLLQRVLKKNASERIISAQALYDELDSLVLNNLVGFFAPVKSTAPLNDETLILRNDDPDHFLSHYTQTTERKQITVLALHSTVHGLMANTPKSDIVESIFQSTRNQYIDIARRFSGFHVGNLGDLTVFYFGYPIASEHDARFAARTALEIISLMNKQQSFMLQQHACELEINIGIHSGILIRRGNQVPEGFASHHAIHLSRLARNKSILCSLDTKAILEPYYRFEEISQAANKSTAVELTAERKLEAYGFVRGIRNASPLLGRASELALLRKGESQKNQPPPMTEDSYHNHRKNACHCIHVYGEAGIGKSRLVHEFRRLESTSRQQVFQCLPENQNNALFPILSMVEYLLENYFDQNISRGKQLTELIQTAKLTGPKPEILTILATWLNIDDIEACQLSTLDPSVQKIQLFEGLLFLLTHCNESNATDTICIFEDIHWADNTTLEFITALAQHALHTPNKVITTSRQPLPDELTQPHFSVIHLQPLDRGAIQEFIRALFDHAPVANDVMAALEARTDGIPLFIEELVSMLKQRRLVHKHEGQINFVATMQANAIPNSVRESIQSKIDCLVYSKDTLQLASTIGREFNYQLLVKASHFSEQQVQNDLAELIENQLVVQQRQVSGDKYIFKHALICDVGYDSIEQKARVEQHEQIANAILTTSKTIDRFIAAKLAHHYKEAEKHEEASHWYYQAAIQSNSTFAIEDSIRLYSSALTACRLIITNPKQPNLLRNILHGLADNLAKNGQHESARQILEELVTLLSQAAEFEFLAVAQIALGKTYEVVHQHNEALQHYTNASASLIKSPHTATPEKSSWWHTWLQLQSAFLYVHYWLGNTKAMKPILSAMEPVMQVVNDKKQIIKYYDDQLHFLLRDQRYVLKEKDIDIPRKALAVAEECDDQTLIAETLFMLGFSLILSGKQEEASRRLKTALELATSYQDKILQTRCCTYLAVSYRLLQQVHATRKVAEKSLSLATAAKMNDYIALGYANVSWSYFAEEDYEQSSHYLKKSLLQWRELASRFEYPFLWISYLHAIVLCQVNTSFANQYAQDISDFANTLCDKRQVPLPDTITQLLLQIAHSTKDTTQFSHINALMETARQEQLI